jgi:hypothetical protein
MLASGKILVCEVAGGFLARPAGRPKRERQGGKALRFTEWPAPMSPANRFRPRDRTEVDFLPKARLRADFIHPVPVRWQGGLP